MLEYNTVPEKLLPIGYRKLSLDLPLVDKVADIVSSSIDPTLSLESEEHIVHIHPTIPLKSEVKVVKSMSSPPDPTLSSESVETEVVTLAQYSSHIPIESELKLTEVHHRFGLFFARGFFYVSIEPSPSTKVISFDWSNIIESHSPSSVPFQIFVQVISRSMLHTIIDEGSFVINLFSTS